ncbi:MAG TPA: amino acid adenylation domain-containing protein, partial [Planctomycetaceae bacterium]|nr:amino acid adenylation domain-containing protein [Planctomycetaceae bacterium]
LTLSLCETEGRLSGVLAYNSDLFHASTIQRMLGHFRVLLEGIVADPELPISQLPLLTASEQHLFMTGANESPRHMTCDKCLHHLFEEQVERTPDAIAVICGDKSITYGELNARANQLAHHLCRLGVGPEKLVGLCMERSLEMIIGILGILKAGGAYVPLDPEYPAGRLAVMLEDATPTLVLSMRALHRKLPDSAKILLYDEPQLQRTLDRAYKCNPTYAESAAPHDGRQPAYVIYTSGSTGVPKGVVVSHWNVVRLFASTRQWFDFGSHDVWSLFHSFAFDFSVWELWGALLYGGRLVVVPWTISRSPVEFLDLMVREKVTVLNQTPSAFYQFLQADRLRPETGSKLSLRYIIFGGEALDLSRLGDWYLRHPEDFPLLVNMYGITETTVHVTYQKLSRELVQTAHGSLIGQAIPDLRVYVLNQSREPQPIGVAGELFVGGEGLARGYLNRPELTAEKFIPDRFVNRPGARMYRTGDLARWRSDGHLEYLGRIDQQVKVRGFRIELGEIEGRLRCHPAVEQVVVAAREDSPGNKRLVAYLVTKDQKAPAIDELRSHLEQTLPSFMIPAAFVTLDALPLTPNGKVDRKALPAPETIGQAPVGDYVAPRTPLEQQLAGIWSRALRVDRVGIRDNFFVLGGDSLMAAEAMLYVRNTSGVDLPLRSLFETPTIADLAALIERESNSPTNGEGDVTTATRLDHHRDSTNDDTRRDELTEKLENIWVRGNALNPSDFCEIVRSGDGGVPIVCVGDARPIPFLLAQLSNSVPILQLKFDGVHIWPPYYLSAANQSDVYVRALEKLCLDKKVAILGWSYGGTLAYRLGLALQDRGWSRIGVFVIEPDTPMLFLPFGQYQLLKRQFRQALTTLFRGEDLNRFRMRCQQPTIPPEIQDLKDRYARWDLMVRHYQSNIDSIRPRPLQRPMALVGSESYMARFADAWRRVAHGSFEQCVFSNTDDHAACFIESRCTDQWLTCLEHWYASFWEAETARRSLGPRSPA